MKRLSRAQVKRLTAVHGWSGTVLGLLLYAVVITGTVVVFAHEIGAWSVGGPRATAPLHGPIDDKVRPLAERVTKGYREEIGVWADARGDLMVFPHAHVRNPQSGELEDYGALFRLDAGTGEVLSRFDGFPFRNPGSFEASALEHFLVDLHVQLYVPEPWGLILTGILGLAMMAAGVTGFLMHRHLIRDLFVAERPGKRLVSARDRHVLAASWALPFAFLLGFTGSFFSFAGTVAVPLLAQVAFGGDGQAVEERLYEAPVSPDPTPAPFANLDDIVARSTGEAGSAVTYIGISHYGRADARITLWHDPPDGQLNYVQNVFSGADGAFLGARPIVGTAPSTGGFVYALMSPLHFGDFAGVLSKSVWVGLGAAMCFVILSGMRLWVRRRADDPLWRGFGRVVTVAAYGLPLAMLASACAFFLSLPAGDPFWWTPAGFLIGAAGCIAAGFARLEDERLARRLSQALACGCLALPVLRMAAGGTDWVEALMRGQGAVLSIDLALLVTGALVLLWKARGRVRSAGRMDRRVAGPAE